MTSIENFNVIITGDKNSGKTSFVNKFLTGNLVGFPTSLNQKVVEVKYKEGRVLNTCTFTFIEKNSVDINKADDSFPCNGLIVMYDLSKDLFRDKTNQTIDFYLKNMDGSVPIVVCGNKTDKVDKVDELNVDKFENCKFCICSVKENKGINDVILSLLKRFKNSDKKIVLIN